MSAPSLVYTPSRSLLWLRVLVREFMVPEIRKVRLLAGPLLLLTGLGGMRYGTVHDNAGLSLMGSVLAGVGIAWASWPLAAAWLAVMRSRDVRRRQPIRLSLTAGVIEATCGDTRQLYALDELENRYVNAGEVWLRFRGDRYLLIPAATSEGDPKTFLAMIAAHEPEAAPPRLDMGRRPPESRT